MPPVGAGRFVHLVLVVVAVNFIACLLAGKAASVADREIKMALSPMTAGRVNRLPTLTPVLPHGGMLPERSFCEPDGHPGAA